MRSVDEHLAAVLGAVRVLPSFEMHLLDAQGCALATDVVADTPLPAWSGATTDGYAVRAADVATASAAAPVSLRVGADIRAGSDLPASVPPGVAAKIESGAPMPSGADAVVPRAWATRADGAVTVTHPVPAGAYVAGVGRDLAAGSVALSRGMVLGAPQIALLSALGRRVAPVHPRPRVVVLSAGSALVEPGEPTGAAGVSDANGFALCAAVREAGGIPYHAGVVPTDPRAALGMLEDHLIRADVVVTTGGLSDPEGRLLDSLRQLGTFVTTPLAMYPGHIGGLGTVGLDATPVVALTGDPVGALVSFEVFVRPALRTMSGARDVHRPVVDAVLAEPVRSAAGRRHFVRVVVETDAGGWRARLSRPGDATTLAGLANAQGLAVVAEDVAEVAAGTVLPVWMLTD